MTKTAEPKIKFFDGEDFTCVMFQPDLSKFKMEKLDKDIVALLTRRAYDIAGSCKGVKVSLNGKKLPVSPIMCDTVWADTIIVHLLLDFRRKVTVKAVTVLL